MTKRSIPAIALYALFVVAVLSAFTTAADDIVRPGEPGYDLLMRVSFPVSVDFAPVSEDLVYVVWHQGGLNEKYGGFELFNIKEARSFKKAWSWKGQGQPLSLEVYEQIAFVGFGPPDGEEKGGRLELFDVKDPLSPQLLGSVSWDADVAPLFLAVANGHAYFGDYRALGVVDVRNTSNPCIIASHLPLITSTGGKYESISDIAANGSFLYVAAGGLRVFDMSEAASPRLIGSYAREGLLEWLALQNQKAYLAIFQSIGIHTWSTVTSGAVHVIDVADPAKPALLQKVSVARKARSFALGDSYVYAEVEGTVHGYKCKNAQSDSRLKDKVLLSCYGGFAVYDVSTPGSPKFHGNLLVIREQLEQLEQTFSTK